MCIFFMTVRASNRCETGLMIEMKQVEQKNLKYIQFFCLL